jgi:hypothetical protein
VRNESEKRNGDGYIKFCGTLFRFDLRIVMEVVEEPGLHPPRKYSPMIGTLFPPERIEFSPPWIASPIGGTGDFHEIIELNPDGSPVLNQVDDWS